MIKERVYLVNNNQGKQTKHFWDALGNTSTDNTTPTWGNHSAHPNLGHSQCSKRPLY